MKKHMRCWAYQMQTDLLACAVTKEELSTILPAFPELKVTVCRLRLAEVCLLPRIAEVGGERYGQDPA